MAITIRQATADDAALLHELAAATFALACPPGTLQSSIDDFVAKNLSIANFESYLADPERDLFIASADEVPAGYTMIVHAEPTDPDVTAAVTTRPTSELSKVYVLAGHHGTGLAAELVRVTVEAARARGAASVWLGVNNENAKANRFYEKQGFVNVGTKHFLVGDKLEDDFVRELVF
jgi:ribosomal protein S18 acetylase RimI-like enzyme